ncbi:hypothetical protein C2845_PM03G14310 [Panicum miliaceum]|uniref:DUF6598 domain-containing protein n=1 Tax=Panicum miliaceum TaxID=4540 RepID=A0A3L6T492_PANMI|nr:hypothetical protein C2845_PM03G14310 [Panicum miliaceum]
MGAFRRPAQCSLRVCFVLFICATQTAASKTRSRVSYPGPGSERYRRRLPAPCCVVVWGKRSGGGRAFGRMSCRKGDDKVASSTSMSNKDSKEEMNFKAPSKMEEDSLFEAPRKTEEAKGPFFVCWNGELWRSKVPVSLESEVPRPRRMEVEEEHAEEHETPELEVIGPDDEAHWMTVSQFRDYWNRRWSGHYYGSFEDTTKIPSMCFAYKPVDEAAVQNDTLQIFSVKLAATRGALQLPLDVFGMVAIRDPVDHNRNIIFQRKRDDCQTLTEKDPYLVLAGPTRAVMLEMNPTIIEVDLQVKGATESEDEQLSFLVAPLRCFDTIFSHLFNCAYTSKLSTLEFTLGHVAFSVEATIFVHVVHGSWPDCYRGLFTASTTGFTDRCPMPVGDKLSTGTGGEGILLLDSRGERLPVAGDGRIELSRRVVSVEGCGKLTVKVNALEGNYYVRSA